MSKITERLFRDSPNLRDRLADLLKDEALNTALSIISESAKPRRFIFPLQGSHLDTIASQQYHILLGVQKTLDHLQRLTTPNPVGDSKDQLEDMLEEKYPFFSSLPQPMQDAIRKNELENQS